MRFLGTTALPTPRKCFESAIDAAWRKAANRTCRSRHGTMLPVRRFRKYCGAGFVESEGAVAKREAAASEKMQVAIMFDVRLLRRGKNLIIALVTSSILQSALAQSHSKPLPEFEDYPVKEVFSGTPHPPILVTR